MLRQPSPAVRHCFKRAAECDRLAGLAKEPEVKNGYLQLSESWRKLADNREFTERMDAFLGYIKE